MTAPAPPSWITPENLALYQKWLAERPPAVRAVAERLPGYCVFRMKSTGQHVIMRVIDAPPDRPITVRVQVTFALNPSREFMFVEKEVFGVSPDDLEIIRVRQSWADGIDADATPESISWKGQN